MSLTKPSQVQAARKHLILLLNFSEQEAELLRKAEFNVEVGYIGSQGLSAGREYLPYYFPRPVYEYEVLVYNSKPPDQEAVRRLFPSVKNLLADGKMMEPLTAWNTPPAVRLAFTGYSAGFQNLVLAGLPFIRLLEAHCGVSIFEAYVNTGSFALPELAKVVAGFRGDIASPVGQYSRWGEATRWPLSHFPVVLNRNGDQIASYGTIFKSRTVPVYVILPQFKSNATVLVKVLNVIARLYPELFPDRELRDWYGSDEFAFTEEKDISRRMEARLAETGAFFEAMRREKAELAGRCSFIKKILVATEDPQHETEERLSGNVRKVLEFLGFQVEDIDAKIRGVIRKEDFWVRDGDFLAITEVTGTANKNPRTKEFNDLLGRRATIFRRHDLVPDVLNISGLLVVNYDINTHPRKRPRLYGGEAEEIVEAAREQSIGLLSTGELYDIAIAAKDGVITKDEARRLVKQFGRIELQPVKRQAPGRPRLFPWSASQERRAGWESSESRRRPRPVSRTARAKPSPR